MIFNVHLFVAMLKISQSISSDFIRGLVRYDLVNESNNCETESFMIDKVFLAHDTIHFLYSPIKIFLHLNMGPHNIIDACDES
jgi:hypothetical protein